MHVVLYHLAQGQLADAPGWLRQIVGNGFVGVSLFFVLSGFILSYSYLDASGQKRVEPRTFWMARFARIYPVYVLGIVVMLPFYLLYLLPQMSVLKAMLKVAAGALVTLSLLQSWVPPLASLINHPSWSLSAEAFFYFVFPFAAPLAARLPPRRLLGLGGALWLVSLVGPLCYLRFVGPGTPGQSGFLIGLLKFNPLLRLPEFLIGVVLGILLLRLDGAGAKASERLAPMLSLAALGTALLVLAQGSRIPYVLMSCVLVPVFALLIYSLAFNRGVLGAFLSLPPVMLLGEASYALYIIHIPLYTILSAAAAKWSLSTSSGSFLLVYLLCAVGTSLLITRFLEKPAREALKRRWARPLS